MRKLSRYMQRRQDRLNGKPTSGRGHESPPWHNFKMVNAPSAQPGPNEGHAQLDMRPQYVVMAERRKARA